MIQVFLDTNVVIDFLADRKPFSSAAAQIFNASVAGKIKLYISAVSYNNIYYICLVSSYGSFYYIVFILKGEKSVPHYDRLRNA